VGLGGVPAACQPPAAAAAVSREWRPPSVCLRGDKSRLRVGNTCAYARRVRTVTTRGAYSGPPRVGPSPTDELGPYPGPLPRAGVNQQLIRPESSPFERPVGRGGTADPPCQYATITCACAVQPCSCTHESTRPRPAMLPPGKSPGPHGGCHLQPMHGRRRQEPVRSRRA